MACVNNRKNGLLPSWGCALLVCVLFLLFQVLCGWVILALSQPRDNGNEVWRYCLMEAGVLLSVVMAIALTLPLEGKSWRAIGLWWRGKYVGRGVVTALVIYALAMAFLFASGQVRVTGVRFDGTNLLIAFCFYFVAALAEEALMRGYVLRCLLLTPMRRYMALGLSAVVFALIHLFNPHFNGIAALNVFLAGIMLGLPYLYTRNLGFSVALHWFWNWLQGPVLGFNVSGNDIFPPLVRWVPGSNTLLHGGEFGFEGSLVCTVLILLCIVWLWQSGKRATWVAGYTNLKKSGNNN